MVGIQLVSARIGRVTGHGLASNIGRHFPRPMLYGIVALLRLRQHDQHRRRHRRDGRGAAAWSSADRRMRYAVFIGVICLLLQVFLSYQRYVRYLKWLTLALLSLRRLVLTIHIPWREVAAHAVRPHFALTGDISDGDRRGVRHDDQPVPVFLAGLAGSRGAQRRSGRRSAGACARRRRRAPAAHQDRHLSRDGVLQHRRVLHHPRHGGDAECRGHHRHPDLRASGRGAAAAGGRLRFYAVRAGHHRHRT